MTDGRSHDPHFRYVALADQLERQIRAGVFRPGDKLPSIRTLHRERGLAIMTVSRSLAELEGRGLAEARPRSGYVVRYAEGAIRAPAAQLRRGRPQRVLAPHPADDFVSSSANPRLVPLGGAVLAPELLPLKHLQRLIKEVVKRPARAFAAYGLPAGAPELRRAIAGRIVPFGHELTADEIVVTSGCMDAVRLALQSVARPGDTVAVESPTFFGFLQAIRDLDLLALEVAVDPTTGIELPWLAREIARHPVRALIVTPTVQNPTGACMPDASRLELLALARRQGVTIIEDDVYGDLYFGERRPSSLSALDPEADVIYCTSFSKTLAPGLRVGWLAPGRHLDRARRLKLSGTITSPAISQLTLAKYLASGAYERHLRRLRPRLRTQLGAARRALAAWRLPGIEVTDPAGGFLLWVRLPRGIDAVAVAGEALRQGIAVMPGTLCTLGSGYRDCLRLNCGNPWTRSFDRAAHALGEIVRAHAEARNGVTAATRSSGAR